MVIDTVLSKKRAAEILLIEDNPADAILAEKAFRNLTIPCRLTVAENGAHALQILRSPVRHDLVLLDLNLPGQSGIEILREVKSDKKLGRIPVIVLTTSRAESDIGACYDLLANCYVIKPFDFCKFQKFVEALAQFWFAHSISPYE